MRLPSELRRDFERLFDGAEVVVVHSAPRTIGRVVGGVDAIADAMIAALGPRRTVVVPTFTAHLTDPASWRHPPAPEALWEAIRDELPAFDPSRTGTRGMGRLAELVWRHPDALRSAHPAESVAAIGPRARELVAPHPLDDPMGARSPWARLYAIDARVLLVGVGLERCSIVHHAEQRARAPYLEAAAYSTFVDVDGDRRWLEVEAGGGCSEAFPSLEPDLVARGALREARVGDARVRVGSARAIVDLACAWLARDPWSLRCAAGTCADCDALRSQCAGE